MPGIAEIKAGAAFVEIFAKDAEFLETLNKDKKRMSEWQREITESGLKIAGLGAAIVTPILASAEAFSKWGSEIFHASERTGIAAEQLSLLKFAAGEVGVGFDTLETSIRRMQKTIFDAEQGVKSAVKTLADLGLNSKDLAGKLPQDQLAAIATKMAAIEDPAEKAAVAMKLFGKSGTDLIPLLEQSGDGIQKLIEKGKSLGVQLSQEDAKSADELETALGNLDVVFKTIVTRIGGAMAPALTSILTNIVEISAPLGKLIQRHGEWVVAIAAVGAGLVALGTALAAVGIALPAITAGIAAVTTVTTGLTIAIGLLLNPITLAIVAIGGLIAALYGLKRAYDEADASHQAFADAYGDATHEAQDTKQDLQRARDAAGRAVAQTHGDDSIKTTKNAIAAEQALLVAIEANRQAKIRQYELAKQDPNRGPVAAVLLSEIGKLNAEADKARDALDDLQQKLITTPGVNDVPAAPDKEVHIFGHGTPLKKPDSNAKALATPFIPPSTAQGTFNAVNLSNVFGASSVQERTAKATEDTAKHTKKIADQKPLAYK